MASANEQSEPNMRSLSRRELQVAKLVQDGLSNKEIAVQLGIVERTVKYHVSHLLKKTGARNRTRLGCMMLEDSQFFSMELNDGDTAMANKVARYHEQEATLEKRLRYVKGMIEVTEDYLSETELSQTSTLPSPTSTTVRSLNPVVPIRSGRGHG
ncbi:MAG TPA: helix-turn-helix transcriptional regulator [Terriglobales bacterium]